jgi:hypothetical protein
VITFFELMQLTPMKVRPFMIKQFLLLFTVFSLPGILAAQIGKEFTDLHLNGPVERITTYRFSETEQATDGTYVGIGYPMKSIVTYKDGFPSLFEYEMHWGDAGEYSQNSKSEVDWQEGKIMQVRQYSDTESRGGRLFKSYMPLYHNGQIVAENILYDKNELRASLVYGYHPAPEGVTIIDMTMYKPETEGSQGHYYFEYDKWGTRVHVESVGQDTGLFTQRVRMEGDSIFEAVSIASSRRNRGTKDTATMRTTIRYDEYENPIYNLVEIEKKSGDPEPAIRMLMISEYDYTGSSHSVEEPITIEQFKGRWVSKKHDIALTLGGVLQDATAGIFSTASLTGDALDIGLTIEEDRIEEDRIADAGDAWIIALTKSGIGEWEYDAATQTITFQQRDHIIAKVQVSLDLFSLLLSPAGNQRNANELLLRKG